MGTSSSRAHTRFHRNYDFVKTIEILNKNFTDSGNFGFNISGSSTKGKELAEALVAEVQDLRNVTEEEVEVAKNQLKVDFLLFEEDPRTRILHLSTKM